MGQINKAAVIGAGTMGAGIAAHLANAGLQVSLLDLDPEAAANAVVRQSKTGGLMDASLANRIVTGSSIDDLHLIGDADWIVEAVVERVDVKRELFYRLDGARKVSSIVSSNTSTIPLSDLLSNAPDSFAAHFLITHFFNPPRRMRLLEIVAGPKTSEDIVFTVCDFADQRLGKGVVQAKDTPGFIANRIGVYWMAAATHEAIRLGLDVEVADALISTPFGISPSGIFGLLDLVGIDLMPMILTSLGGALPAGDPLAEYVGVPPELTGMIANGQTGRKAGSGFYRVSDQARTREVWDIKTQTYRQQLPLAPEILSLTKSTPRQLLARNDAAGAFVSTVMEKTLSYAARLVPEIADTPDVVDTALRLGFSWKRGPFQLMDSLGPSWLCEQLNARRLGVPEYLAKAAEVGHFYDNNNQSCLAPDGRWRPIAKPAGVFLLADLKLRSKPILSTEEVCLWDIGDGVGLAELNTKLGTLSSALLSNLQQVLIHAKRFLQAMVIGGDSNYFSAGANLRDLVKAADSKTGQLSRVIDQGQDIFRWIKFAPFPTVAAITGATLGGGCELALHCKSIQADAELNLGLVEANVGLIPGWGGCKEMLLRFSEATDADTSPEDSALKAFNLIRKAVIVTSAFEARARGYLRQTDGITMNRDRLLADAKKRALLLAANYNAPKTRSVTLSGSSGAQRLRDVLEIERDSQQITPHDFVVSSALIDVLTGGIKFGIQRPVSENELFVLEREAFVSLFETRLTKERIINMLNTGKPLRN